MLFALDKSLQSLHICPYLGPVLPTDTAERAPGRRDRKKQQTRAALIAAALRLVDERGLERVTVEEISAAADVSPRTFFNYFTGKDEALTGDSVTDAREITDRLRAVPPEVPMLDALRQALEPATVRIQADRELWLTRMRVINRNPSLLPALLARSAAVELEFIAAFAERAGLPSDSPYPRVAAAVSGAAFRAAMMRWAEDDGARPFTEFVHESFDIVATGLTPPPPSTPA
jgi:AcrR family transcriptional regulator